MKKYSEFELQLIRKLGKKGLQEYYKIMRKCSSTRPNIPIESKKYKEKYNIEFDQ